MGCVLVIAKRSALEQREIAGKQPRNDLLLESFARRAPPLETMCEKDLCERSSR